MPDDVWRMRLVNDLRAYLCYLSVQRCLLVSGLEFRCMFHIILMSNKSYELVIRLN